MTLYIDDDSPTGLSKDGKPVGWNTGRYWRTKIKGKPYMVHRLIIEMQLGKPIPQHLEVDHIDGNGLNNLVSNLRLVTRSQNVQNTKVRNDSNTGIKGITMKGSCYQASIQLNGKRYTKRFADNLEEAIRWVESKRTELHTHRR